jgi:hypothetical protein
MKLSKAPCPLSVVILCIYSNRGKDCPSRLHKKAGKSMNMPYEYETKRFPGMGLSMKQIANFNIGLASPGYNFAVSPPMGGEQ